MTVCNKISCLLGVFALLLASTPGAAKQLNGFEIRDPLVPMKLIKSGGPPRDGIPAIDAPRFVDASDSDHLTDSDRVLGIQVNGIARAYPIRILNYHEIVNDRFGELPVAVTFCPLCGTGIAFNAAVAGQARSFGVSGLLYNSDVLMYDRQSESLWSQILGQAISGPAKGQLLTTLPVRHTTWADWLRRHPDTQVLAEPRWSGRNYNVDPYLGYADSSRVWFPVAKRDKRYPSKAVVVGVVLDGATRAWPFIELPQDQQAITDEIAGQVVTVEYDLVARAARVIDSDGNEIPSFTAFWFAWVAFHPDTGIYKR